MLGHSSCWKYPIRASGGKYPMAVPRLPPIYFCDWILFFLGLDSLVLDSLPCVSIQLLAVSRFEYFLFSTTSRFQISGRSHRSPVTPLLPDWTWTEAGRAGGSLGRARAGQGSGRGAGAGQSSWIYKLVDLETGRDKQNKRSKLNETS